MGRCRYCGEKAGFLLRKHPECHRAFLAAPDVLLSELFELGKRMIPDEVTIESEENGTISLSASFDDEKLSDELAEEIKKCFLKAEGVSLPKSKQKDVAMEACFSLVDHYLEDDNLGDNELGGVFTFNAACDLGSHEKQNLFGQLIEQARILNRISKKDTSIPNITTAARTVEAKEDFPLLLMKSEKLVHTAHVEFHEERTKTLYVGGSDGVSIRIAKGVYYRTSGFKGERIQEHNMEIIDSGLFALTTKHIYFHGSRKSFRTRLDRVVAIEPFSDGIGIRKAGTTARPQIFRDLNSNYPINSWFVANAIRSILDN
jgi:hypothetical protein